MRRILVLRRADQHPRLPGHYDVMVGGAVDVGESYEVAAARELSEELGACVPVRFMFKFLCREGVSPVWFGVHEAVLTEPLVPDPSEIGWHAWLTEAELGEVVDRWPFVPAGREAWRRYSELGNESPPYARLSHVPGDHWIGGRQPWTQRPPLSPLAGQGRGC
ncbi:MAG: NUDIX domain-containing protein [Nonomuraea sp.]|nr:NUDIX domain-containing protein [Nonomuraea sp.]